MADTPRSRAPNFTKPDGVALKEHLEARIAAQHDFFMAQIAATEKANILAQNRISDQLCRDKADIADLKRSRDQAAGKASQTSVIISYLIGGVGLIFGLVNLLVH